MVRCVVKVSFLESMVITLIFLSAAYILLYASLYNYRLQEAPVPFEAVLVLYKSKTTVFPSGLLRPYTGSTHKKVSDQSVEKHAGQT